MRWYLGNPLVIGLVPRNSWRVLWEPTGRCGAGRYNDVSGILQGSCYRGSFTAVVWSDLLLLINVVKYVLQTIIRPNKKKFYQD